MKKKDYLLGKKAREAIIEVATHFGNIVGKTLGPAGRSYLLPSGITNDGKTIGYQIRYDDECKDYIAIVFMDVAEKTDDEVGDGTTTAVVVSTTLAIDTFENLPASDSPVPGQKSVMQIKRDLEEEGKKAVEILSSLVKDVNGDIEILENVAQTSMENPEVAKLIADTIMQVGKDSVTLIQEGFGGEVTRRITSGIKLPLKLAAPYMYNTDRKEAIHDKVPILVANHVFEEYSELAPFMTDYTAQQNVPGRIVIVGKKFSVPFIGECAKIQKFSQEKFQIILLTADLDADQWEDLAAYVDAQLIDTHPKTGRSIGEAKYAHCGFADKVIAGEVRTAFMGGRGLSVMIMTEDAEPMSRVSARVNTIREALKSEEDKPKRDLLEKRAAEMTGGVATIFVDADTAVERHYLRLKAEDAMNASKAALDQGVVPGGGVALKTVAEELGVGSPLYRALMAPYERIQRNNGEPLAIPSTALDPFASAKAAIENSVSAIKILIMLEGVIADHVQDPAGELLARFSGAE